MCFGAPFTTSTRKWLIVAFDSLVTANQVQARVANIKIYDCVQKYQETSVKIGNETACNELVKY